MQAKKNIFSVLDNSWWSVAVIAALTGMILYQAWQVRHRPVPARVQAQLLAVGEQIPAVAVESLQGQAQTIDWIAAGQPSIVYVFRPDCVWCRHNRAGARMLLEHSAQYRFIGLSTSAKGLKEYVAENRLTFPVYVASSKTIERLKLGVTPETIVVASGGRVQKVWPGAYGGAIVNQIESMFGFKLPALEM